MAFVQDSRPSSAWTRDARSPSQWYFNLLVEPFSTIAWCFDTGIPPYSGWSHDSIVTSTWTQDSAASSTWAQDGGAGTAAYFDTWDDSFDLIETCFDDDNEVPGQEFTEDTHP